MVRSACKARLEPWGSVASPDLTVYFPFPRKLGPRSESAQCESDFDPNFLVEHVLFAKPVPTFAEHAPTVFRGIQDMNDEERHAAGTKVRRAVLGEAHVDRAQARLNDFNRDFQDFITRTAWGEVWSRPGLERKTRSLLTLCMTIALNREAEFRIHVIGALNNGVTRDEIKETILHAAIYCGVPAANSAMHWAEAAFAVLDEA
jgi:4-carboxymuconolactone decarboxylase